MAELDPDQAAALRRLRAAFGFVEILAVDHEADQDNDDEEAVEDQGRDHRPAGTVPGRMPRPQGRLRARRRGNGPTPVACRKAPAL